MLALLFAFAVPILGAAMNLFDKYVVSKRVKKPLAYTAIAGFVPLLYGLLLATFVSWDGTRLAALFPSIVAGLVMGVNYYFYYFILNREDASLFTGFNLTSPLLVALLAFFLLGEQLTALNIAGVVLVVIGALLLALRGATSRKSSYWLFVASIANITIYEFLIKFSTTNLGELQGLSLSMMTIGVTICCGLLSAKIRAGAREELRNIGWAFAAEAMTFLVVGCLYFAMGALPAAIVVSIDATRPLFTILYERLLHWRGAALSSDYALLPRLGAIALIIAGVVLLTVTGT